MDADTIYMVVLYLIVSYTGAKTGEKFRIGAMQEYFIPIYGQVLLCKCARISPWWVLGMFVPLVNLVACVRIYGKLAQCLGKNFWLYGLGSFFLIPMLIIALDSSKPVDSIQEA
ncbi:MAG TPA: DUF5684 domain-containing protein [Patescibacteria group bacterium]|nr:DUF5684 domain-containing protein [Patescibacteria group bacterium]